MNSFYLAVFGLGGGELIAILAIILVLFGSTKLPALARGLGQSVKEFKKASQDDEEDKAKAAEAAKKTEAGKANGSN